jgi:hypothetical protein
MSVDRDWSVFIGERLNAPWTSDRAGAALMPEHLRQVVPVTLLASPQWWENTSGRRGPVACSKVKAPDGKWGTGREVVHDGVTDQASSPACSCSGAPSGARC